MSFTLSKNFLVIVTALASMAVAAPADLFDLAPYYPASQYALDGSYIVRLKDGCSLQDHLNFVPGLLDLIILKLPFNLGYSAGLLDVTLNLVRQDKCVQYVEQNSGGEWLDLEAQADTEAYNSSSILESRDADAGVGYALKYLSSNVKNPADDSYFYLANSGAGVDLYIMDSGINGKAPEFEGRVTDLINRSDDPSFNDKRNHGTGVAGCAGSRTYGAAKKPNLLNVKIKTTADVVIAALGDVVNRHNSQKSVSGFKGSIINMSFRTGASQTASEALKQAFDAGIAMVAAAGNDGEDASGTFPCNSGYTTCIGSSGSDYRLAASSNRGQAVDFVASGDNVYTVANAGNAPIRQSGTSFAAPYAAGVLAVFYGYQGPNLSPSDAADLLFYNADADYIENMPADQANFMINSGFRKATGGQPYRMGL
ncbi:subtilisin-like protein, partial [Aureobasidium melanogenum]